MGQAATASTGKREAMLHALAFIAGFTVVFVIAGATASAIGTIFNDYRTIITTVLGVVVILLGVNMLGLFRLPFLQMDKRLRIRRPGVSYAGSVLVGIGFAAGWSPCIGPILAAVLAMASDEKTVYAAMGLLLVYSAGLAIPFFLAAFALVLGGAVGNILDRIRLGYVVDFVDLHWFPVFNVADSCITIGVCLLLYRMIVHERSATSESGSKAAE
jgi:cytochrome c biogenesis protein CcdA